MTKYVITVLSLVLTFGVDATPPSIGSDKAQNYEIATEDKINESNNEHIFVCAATTAATKDERAQTMIKIVLDVANKSPDLKIALYLAPHVKLCQVGRLIGTAYYSPTGEGWKGAARGKWTWNILTTGSKVSEQEITDTIIYEDHKLEFKKKYGAIDYSEKLDEFVVNKLGRKPKYVTSGLWVDTFFVE